MSVNISYMTSWKITGKTPWVNKIKAHVEFDSSKIYIFLTTWLLLQCQQLDQADIKENTKTLLTDCLLGKSVGDRWTPMQKASTVEVVSISWRHNSGSIYCNISHSLCMRLCCAYTMIPLCMEPCDLLAHIFHGCFTGTWAVVCFITMTS